MVYFSSLSQSGQFINCRSCFVSSRLAGPLTTNTSLNPRSMWNEEVLQTLLEFPCSSELGLVGVCRVVHMFFRHECEGRNFSAWPVVVNMGRMFYSLSWLTKQERMCLVTPDDGG